MNALTIQDSRLEVPADPVDSLRDWFRHAPAFARTTPRERIRLLRHLRRALLARRVDIQEAIRQDFSKSGTETDFSEILTVTAEIRTATRHLRAWTAPIRVSTPILLIGNRSEIRFQPKGAVLIMSPWNFPVNLCLIPLVSAIAAGNTVCIKPSEFTPRTNAVLDGILREVFPPEVVRLVQGGPDTGARLLDLPFRHVFFTGSQAVGRIVAETSASMHRSFTLELGGKSPAIVTAHANLDLAADRIVWGKFYNAGQICIAPDLVFVHTSRMEAFLDRVTRSIRRKYGEDPRQSPDLARMIHDHHFRFQEELLADAIHKGARVHTGGQTDAESRYVAPTVLTNVHPDSRLLREEIFGPILPVIPYTRPEEVLDWHRQQPVPLAFYLFTSRRSEQESWLAETRAGNTAVNTVLAQFFNGDLPFGGEQQSGMGKAHGFAGFQAFSNARAIMKQTARWSAVDLIQPPFRRLARFLADLFLWWY